MSDDNYGDVQQPAGGYGTAGGAGASTGYGNVQNPPSPYNQKQGAAAAVNPIDLVKNDLKGLNVSLQGANLVDMDTHPHGSDFQNIGFLAWTNSSQSIYVNVKDFDPQNPMLWRQAALVGVRHEIFHVVQFKGNKANQAKGGRPQSFAEMISFEAKAYANTVEFLDDPKTKAFLIKNLRATQQDWADIRKTMTDEGAEFAAETKVKASDPDYLKWLIDPSRKFLPPTLNGKAYKSVDDLYT